MNLEQRAHYEVTRARQRGLLEPDACAATDCLRWPTEAHHEDYAKPLEVIWLCRLHHRLRHGDFLSVAAMLDYLDGLKAASAAARLSKTEAAA